VSTPLAEIALVAFDVDGVLTDGRIWFDEEGREMHAFHVKDGMGLVLAAKRGLILAAISGRRAPGVKARLTQLRMKEIHLGVMDKAVLLREVAERHQVPLERICFVGDDVNDLQAMAIAGLSFAPADAIEEVRAAADRVTQRRGGEGVLREVLDALFAARGDTESESGER
jgi:3-deoxy-D-manno-octulosonate 8-phosphate phosphatase (KDO 8-P phosphatase)